MTWKVGSRAWLWTVHAVATVVVFAAALVVPALARASNSFPIINSFQSSTLPSGWHLGGSAALTSGGVDPAGQGWLRLTGVTNYAFGYVVDDNVLPDNNGVLLNFDYATWGGTGADGLSFFLYDGATPYASFATGPTGGSLGYASCPQNSEAGLTNAYIGLSFDEYGNFANNGFCGLASPLMPANTRQPNRVTIRGSGNNQTGYSYLASVATSETLQAQRTQARHVTISITPALLISAYITYPDGTTQTIVSDYQLPAAPVSGTLKFGFVASTGGATNNHEIRNSNVAEPTDLLVHGSGPASSARNSTQTYTYTITNSGPNDATPANNSAVNVHATASAGGPVNNVTWTCTGSGGATCANATGSGLPNVSADSIPVTGAETYTITTHDDPTDDYTGLSLSANPTTGVGQINPSDATAAVKTDLAAVAITNPHLTLTDTSGYAGSAVNTPGSYLGGDVAITDYWQHCDASGNNCQDISGATGTSYITGPGDYGYTLRVREHVSNLAGSSDDDTLAYTTVPSTGITAHPAADTNQSTGHFTLSTGISGAAFQCRLDAGAWTNCASPWSTGALADGPHVAAFRAVYAGLSDLSSPPVGYRWTVDTAAPAAPVISAPASGAVSADVSPTVTVTGEPGATVTVEVDGSDYGPVQLDGSGNGQVRIPGPLSAGQHAVRARQADPAGNVGGWSVVSTWTVKVSTNVHLTGPSAGPTNATTPAVRYLGEAADEYVITVDGQSTLTGVIPAGGVGSIALPTPLADGSHTIAIIATDAAGNQASDSVVLTIDTVDPHPVDFRLAPGAVTNTTSATFSLADNKPGVQYQCSLDGAAFSSCQTPVTFSGLQDGPHMLLVRAVDDAGNVSPGSQYVWTVKTTPPPQPVILGGPSSVLTPGATVFEFSPVPGTTFKCSLDGGAYQPCPGQYSVPSLPLGTHSLAVQQVDEAGNVSLATVYHWAVLPRSGPRGLPRSAKLLVAANATVAGRRTLDVGCSLNAGSVRRCYVTAYHHGERIGSGLAFESTRGHTHVIVTVWLTPAGRRLLARATGGLPVTLKGAARPFDFTALHPSTSTVLYQPLRYVLSGVLFKFGSSRLTPAAHVIVRGIARQLAGAQTVVCEGNTDWIGSYAYNYALGLRRAEAVCTMLRRLGVRARFSVVSFADHRPVASNQTTAGRHLNRRVVVRVSYRDLPRARPGR